MLELEALRAEPTNARPDLDLLAGAELGAEVDLDAREDELAEPAEEVQPRLLEVGRVDRVVDVAERVAIPEADALPANVRERRRLFGQSSCHVSPRRIGTAVPFASIPSTSTSGPPIMKSVWIVEVL